MEEQAECMLVIIGATPEGKKELLGFQVGLRESTQSWRELLVSIKSRGAIVKLITFYPMTSTMNIAQLDNAFPWCPVVFHRRNRTRGRVG